MSPHPEGTVPKGGGAHPEHNVHLVNSRSINKGKAKVMEVGGIDYLELRGESQGGDLTHSTMSNK